MTVASSTSAPSASDAHRSDRLAELLVVDADDQTVDDAVDALDGFFDLLGEDLLAAGVDDLAAASEQDQRSVGVDHREVAGERVADTVDGAEGACRLLLVLEVADRDVAACGDHADLAGAGLDLAVVVGEHLGGGHLLELGGLGVDALHRDLGPHRPLGRSHRVDDDHLFDPLDEIVLDLGREHHARGENQPERRQVVLRPIGLALVDRPDERLGEAVADDGDRGDAVFLDLRQDLVRVEAAALEGDDLAAGAHRDEPAEPAPRAVHERGARDRHHARPLFDGALDEFGHGRRQRRVVRGRPSGSPA